MAKPTNFYQKATQLWFDQVEDNLEWAKKGLNFAQDKK